MIVKGIDTIEFGIDIFDYFSSFEEILYECKQLKAEAQETGVESEICLNGVNMKVHRNGIPFYAYKLTCNDFSICLMDKEMNENPPVKVRFMSSYLWSYGFEESFRLFCEWFEKAFEHSINGTRISRLDICMDSDEISFCESDIKGIVTRAHGMTKFFVSDEFHEGRLFSGFTIGRGDPILLRIYNKTLEIKKSQKTWFHQIWEEAGWDSHRQVWRVEFQLRRKVLKELQIDDVKSFFKIESALWAYLTEQWMLIKQPKGENVSRWKLKRKWVLVQKAFFNQTVSPLTREKVLIGNTIGLLNQGAGILHSLACLNNHKSLEETARVLGNWADYKLKLPFEAEMEKRKKRYLEQTGPKGVTRTC